MESSRDEARAALDERALERLFVKLEKPMFNVVYRWLWNANDAEEVVQEAFLRVWKARERVELETVEALLFRAAVNLASNRRRTKRLWGFFGLEAAGDPESAAPGALDAIARAEDDARVRRAIDALPERLREVVVLAEFSELSYGEIAAALDIPIGTVGSRRNKALAVLGEALGGLDGEGAAPMEGGAS